jgi:prepilin-type N-terminal cleavage/methylation domain-containing protein
VLHWQLLTPGGKIEGCAVAQFAAEGKLPQTSESSPRNSDAIAMIQSHAACRRFRRSAKPGPVSPPISGATAGLSSSVPFDSRTALLDKPAVAPRGSRGFTLIEMLVALAATLLMMGATVTLFGVIVDSVSGSRALLEISDKLRATRNRIQADLQGATASMRPPLRPENDEGYLEIVEGPNFDGAPNAVPPPPGQPPLNTLFGDTDDALLLTVRSRGEPFVGKFNATTMESQVAEVLYFLKQDGPIIDATTTPPLRLCTLYRRALLVVPGQQAVIAGQNTTAPTNTVNPFYDLFDVSARVEPSGRVANTLGDLTKPENRIGHPGAGAGVFPFRFTTNIDPTLAPLAFNSASGRLGDDILMTNVLSFDVQVYDPGAPVFPLSLTNADPPPPVTAVEPRDAYYRTTLLAWIDSGYAPNSFPVPRISPVYFVPPPPPRTPPLPPNTPVFAYGAYVDLGYGQGTGYVPPSPPASVFFDSPNPKSGIPATRTPANPYVYDTWSWHYENDGVLQLSTVPGPPIADAGTNGLDDHTAGPGFGIVDDIDERDTMPPYSAPLRGVRITIRVYEPSSLQVRQVTIVQDFLSE